MKDKILYIGEPCTAVSLYKRGDLPSHWFYGAGEMEQDEFVVEWESETLGWLNDLQLLIKHNPDKVFIPNLNIRNHLLLMLLKTFGLVRTPIYAYLHHSPQQGGVLRKLLNKILYRKIDHLFFLSEKTMHETINMGVIPSQKCSVPGWGPDIDFYDKIKVSEGDYFISTGKENRDFDILIEAFCQTGAPLKIVTAANHGSMDYTSLVQKCNGIPNIEVKIVDNSGSNYQEMLKLMASAKALVCPLLQDKLNYCVGLSTIADAEGLGKPLIITRNPYHDAERMKGFSQVETVEDWIEAINKITLQTKSEYSMKRAYENMRRVMFAK